MRLCFVLLLAACGPVGPREYGEPPPKPVVVPSGPFVVVERSGSGSRLVLVDESGQRVRAITDAGGEETVLDLHPAWSPDGKRVVFASTRGRGRLDRYALWSVAADQLDAVPAPLVPAEGDATDWFPVWSPDGKRVVFASSRSGDFDLYQVGGEGGAPTPLLVRPESQDIEPALSPDGKRLVFTAVGETGRELSVLDLASQEVRGLGDGQAASFAPDGRWLVFVARQDGRADLDVFRTGLDGAARRVLIDDPLGDEGGPRLSADGRWLFASSLVRDGAQRSQFAALLVAELGDQPAWKALRERHPAARLGVDVRRTRLDGKKLAASPSYADAVREALLDADTRKEDDPPPAPPAD